MKRAGNLKFLVFLSQAIGLLITLIGTFLGAFYWLKGSIIFASLIAVFSVGIMYFFVNQFCRAKAQRGRTGYPNKILLMFVLYGVISIVVSLMVLHCYNVEVLEKEEIKKQGQMKVNGLKQIYDNFKLKSTNWIEDYHLELETTIKELQQGRSVTANTQKLEKTPFNFEAKEIQEWKTGSRGAGLTTLINEHKKVYQKSINDSYTNRLGGDTTYFNRNQDVFTRWNRLALFNAIIDLDQRIVEDYQFLNAKIANFTQNEITKLDVNIESMTQPLEISNPTALAQKHKGLSTIFIVLGFQLLILLPFLLTSGRSFGK
ncbi:MAG: hypothetical protein EBV00_00325 [Burkholderiaceae bacterium]|nr:hypothetical protein [Burkholderiaceae bacterium]